MLKPLAKSALIPLGLTAAASVTDAGLEKNFFGSRVSGTYGSGSGSNSPRAFDSGTTTTILIISNEEVEDIMKIVEFLNKSNLLIKGVSEQLKMNQKNKKIRLLGVLLGTLGANLLGNLLTGNVVNAGDGLIRVDEEATATSREGQLDQCKIFNAASFFD